MISKEMYNFLLYIPRKDDEALTFEEIKSISGLDNRTLHSLIHSATNYRIHSGDYVGYVCVEPKKYFLTEYGQAVIEDYEQAQRNDKITRSSLKVAKIAMWVSIFSAITALVSLLKMFI